MSVFARVFALLVLQVGLACCFTWDIVVSEHRSLHFYSNGTLTHKEDTQFTKDIHYITYDPVHYRVLFSNGQLIASYDILTGIIQPVLTKKPGFYFNIVYDPATQLLFWRKGLGIYSSSLKPASSNETADENLVIITNFYSTDIAVDSCGGFIYWITDMAIERARFDGSDRETLINSTVRWRYSLAIDPQMQKMYWTEEVDRKLSIESADLNGKNRSTFYTIKNGTQSGSLTVSSDFIYWNSHHEKAIWQLPKNHSQQTEPKKIASTNRHNAYFQCIAANYTIREQVRGNQKCKSLQRLLQNETKPAGTEVKPLCVHGTEVSGESRCECSLGYTGDNCDLSVCQNYCLQGNCTVSAEGRRECRCEAGYSGERCEVNVCHDYCLNDGVCSLNEEHEPVCQCTADFDGERCAIPADGVKCIRTISMLKDILNADILPTCT